MNAGARDVVRDRRIWWQLALFVGITTVAVLAGMAFERQMSDYLPESKTMPSAFNNKPSGYSGASELAQKLGFKVHQWQESYRRLSSVSGTLVIVSPLRSAEPYEVKQILEWVNKGNNLIYLDHFDFTFQKRLLESLGLDSKGGTELIDSKIAIPKTGEPLLRFVDHLVVSASNRLTGRGNTIVSDDSGALVKFTNFGDGKVIIASIPSLCSNRRLGNQDSWDNFQFFMNCLGTTSGDIYFDEFSHGYSSGHNVFVFLGRGPLGLIFVQLALLLGIGVVAACQRFGATRVVPVKRKTSNLEFISGMANAYQRARATDLAWQIISHSFLTRIARSLGMSPKESPETIAQSLSADTGASSAELQRLLEKSAGFNGRKPSNEQLLELVGSCDKITDRLKSGSTK